MKPGVPLAVGGPEPYNVYMLRRPATGVTGADGAVVRKSGRRPFGGRGAGSPPRQQHPGPAGVKIIPVMTDTARALSTDPAARLQAAMRRRMSPTTRPLLSPAPRRAAIRCGTLG